MRALVLYCHPSPESFTSAVRDVVLARLSELGAETRMHDLYGEGFDPVLSRLALSEYADETRNKIGVQAASRDLLWCDTLIFIYPTWWYGLPAMLKGWLDRVMLPGVAFHLPQAPSSLLRPGLQNVCRIGVFTTCGSPWWVMWLVGQPGRRTLLRGVGILCARRKRTLYAALYGTDSAGVAKLDRHLRCVRRSVDKLMRGAKRQTEGES